LRFGWWRIPSLLERQGLHPMSHRLRRGGEFGGSPRNLASQLRGEPCDHLGRETPGTQHFELFLGVFELLLSARLRVIGGMIGSLAQLC
jgi:hypothetical protein